MPDMIVADGDRLIQIMYNLIGNAGMCGCGWVGGGGGGYGVCYVQELVPRCAASPLLTGILPTCS